MNTIGSEKTETFQTALQYLYQLQRLGIKYSLDNIRNLMEILEAPHTLFPSIHIAGTNGKGSTAAIMQSVLMNAGYKVGLYTSPHLVSFTERIRINQEPVPTERILAFMDFMRPHIDKIQPSFFEATTALAFWHFAKEKIDIAIIETGMGGRLDATNILEPIISVISPVDYDHQNYLGNTLSKIAGEKAGIIKPYTPFITNNVEAEVLEILREKCAQIQAKFINVNDHAQPKNIRESLRGTFFDLKIFDHLFESLYLNLPGSYQIENAILALGTLISLENIIKVSKDSYYEGLKNIRWPGRLQIISESPLVIVDVSHNPVGFRKTLSFLQKFLPLNRIQVLTALQEDKDFREIGRILGDSVGKCWVTGMKEGKPLKASIFIEEIRKNNGEAEFISSTSEFFSRLSIADVEEIWLVIGSHYLAGDILSKVQLS